VLTCLVAFALERDEDWTLLIPVLYNDSTIAVDVRVLFRSVKEAYARPVGARRRSLPPLGPTKTPEIAPPGLSVLISHLEDCLRYKRCDFS